MHKRN